MVMGMGRSFGLLVLLVTVIPISLCQDPCSGVTSTTMNCTDEGRVCIVQTSSTITFHSAGRVHICRGGKWGTVAVDDPMEPWSEKNAQVACREAGFSGAINSIFPNTVVDTDDRIMSPSFPVHYTGVQCTGSEGTLLDCQLSSDVSRVQVGSSFSHMSDVFVVCRPNDVSYSDVHESGVRDGDLRLFGSQSNGRGGVEIYSSVFDQWNALCTAGWDDSDAAVICRQFGYEFGVADTFSSTPPTSNVQLTGAECTDDGPGRNTGNRFNIGKCSFSEECDANGQYAGVVCSSGSRRDGDIRLFGSNRQYEGIVEVNYNGKWGMVCRGSEFSLSEVRAVCRQLNLGDDDVSPMSATSLLDEESRMKAIWLRTVDCGRSDDSFTGDCDRGDEPIGYGECMGSLQIAAVRCEEPGNGLSSGAITGIVFAIIFLVFFAVPMGYYFGGDYWKKRHQYDWYNTLTTPSKWCECDCCNSPPSQRTFELSLEREREEITTQPLPGTTEPPAPRVEFGGFTRRASSDSSIQSHEEVSEAPEKPGFSQAPPPTYNTAENFPAAKDKPQDLPPPYPGPTVGFMYPPPQSGATASPPAAAGYGAYPQPTIASSALAPIPPPILDPAYPPPAVAPFQEVSNDSIAPPPSVGYTADHAYPPVLGPLVEPSQILTTPSAPGYPIDTPSDPAHPPTVQPLPEQQLPYPVNLEYGGGAYPPPTVQGDSN